METSPVPPCSSHKESWGSQAEPRAGGELCLLRTGPPEQGAGAGLPTPGVWTRGQVSRVLAHMQRPSGVGCNRLSETSGQASGFDVAPACVCVCWGVAGILQEQAAERHHLLPKMFLEMLLL